MKKNESKSEKEIELESTRNKNELKMVLRHYVTELCNTKEEVFGKFGKHAWNPNTIEERLEEAVEMLHFARFNAITASEEVKSCRDMVSLVVIIQSLVHYIQTLPATKQDQFIEKLYHPTEPMIRIQEENFTDEYRRCRGTGENPLRDALTALFTLPKDKPKKEDMH